MSTDEQANKGFSLPHQKNVLQMYCSHKGITILEHFEEDYSAKNFDRPSFKNVLAYLKIHRKQVDYFYITRWDRFSRNVEEAYRVIREFREQGIEVNAIEQPLDFSQPDSKIMLAVYLVVPEVENDKIGIRTKEGLRRAMKEGCFVSLAPFGYKNCRNEDGKATLELDGKKADLVRKAFREYGKGILSTEEIRRKYYNRGLKLSKQGLLNLLKNPVYCGQIHIKEWKKEDELIVEGLHHPIIDRKTFDIVQRLLKGKQKAPIHKFTVIDEHLPLRGYLECPKCSRALTGSGSKGRNGKRHFYYHCQPKCKVRFKAHEVNDLFDEVLSQLVIKEDVKSLYKEILTETFQGERKDRIARQREIKSQLSKLKLRLESAGNKFLDDLIDANTYNTLKTNTQLKINELKLELENLKETDRNIEEYLKLGISFLHGVDKLYKSSPADIKKKIVGSIFPEKLVFLKNRYRTASLDPLIAAIISKNEPFKKLEIKNPANFGGKSSVAPQTGLEPVTL